MTGAVLDEEGAPHRARLHALHGRPAVRHRLHHAEVVEVAHLEVVLGVGYRRAQHLLDEPRGGAGRELESGEGLAHGPVADLVEDEPRLAGGHADEAGARDGEHGPTPSPWARWRPS